jgi:hypothetical protein
MNDFISIGPDGMVIDNVKNNNVVNNVSNT